MPLQSVNRKFGPAVPATHSDSGDFSAIIENLRTYMQFSDKVPETVRESYRERNFYSHSWEEVSKAFEKILDEVDNESVKSKMKARFGELEQDKFSVPVSSVIQDNKPDISDTISAENTTNESEGSVVAPASNVDDNPQVQTDNPQSKPAEVKNKIDDKKLESVMKAVDEYIYGNTSLYAKEIIEVVGEKDVALSILKHLNSEAEKKVKRGEPKIKCRNLFKLAVNVGAKSFADEDVKKSLRILLYEISDRCQDDFIRFETKKEDFKDSFLQYMPMVESVAERFGMADFMEEIRQIHKDSLCAILKDEKVLKKYEALFANYSARAAERAKVRKEAALKREAERKAREEEKKRKEEEKKRKAEEKKRKAEERAAAKAKADAEKKNKNKKDTVSENGDKKDKTKTAEGNNPKPIQPKKGAGKMTEENEFTPSEVQKEACKKAGIEDIGRFKDESSLIAALKERGYEIKNNEVLPINSSDGNGENNEKAGKEGETGGKPKEGADKEGDTKGKEDETDDKDKSITVNTGPVKEKDPEIHEEAPAVADWIKEKIEYYDKMSRGEQEGCPKLENYHHDDTIKDGFAATFDNGGIHYTNKYSVTVSPESGLKIFEVLVTEPHNKGRPVNFGPNLEHKQAVLLLAACLIHGNPVGNNPPELSPEDLEMLKRDLEGRTIKDETGKEIPAYAALEESLAKYTAKGGEEKKKEGTDKTAETEGDKPKAFDDETKGKIKEALEHQYELSAMESSGNLRKDDVTGDMYYWEKNSKTGVEAVSPEKTREYKKLKDNQAEEKGFLAKKFVENTDEVRAIAGEVVNDRHKEKIEKLRKEMAQKKGAKEGTTLLDEHNDRATRVAAKQEEMAIVLGIKDPEKGLTGDALKEYISKNNISQFTYARLLAKENEGKAPDQQKKANDTVYNMCNKTSAILTKDKENGGK